ncbi:bicaudal-D-related protein 2-like isoform X1 [Lepisosteus oculatus]|uniref:bicaudal-D-related protein 2-like isoform X1 n=1 Tax=Lepisosteus oculatus TaxID=7918 RepID=UPI00371D3CF5
MSRLDGWGVKSHALEPEEEFYSFDFDSEDLSGCQDPSELLVTLKQKEEDLILAAELGNALLRENGELKEQNEKLHEKYADRLEELEQGRHELQVRLEGQQSQWESQVTELEKDMRELSSEVQRLTQALRTTEREKNKMARELTEQNHQLLEQLDKAVEAERALTAEVQALKDEFQKKASFRRQDEELIHTLREQVASLSEKKLDLERQVEALCQEKTALRDSMASLHKHVSSLEEQSRQQTLQLKDCQQEVEIARGRSLHLQSQLEELQEEASLRDSSGGEVSLQSELEQSLDSMSWSQDKEQVTREVLSILKLMLPIPDCSPEEGLKDIQNQQDSLLVMLSQIKKMAQRLAQCHSSQELNHSSVLQKRIPCENQNLIQQLQDQNALPGKEDSELMLCAERMKADEILQQAIWDRDEAIGKKNAMENELIKCKNEMMSLNNQLLEAIQRKLELSQELEAWQDDIQVIINQQLKTQQQTDQAQRKNSVSTGTGRLSFLRRPSTPTLRTRHLSSTSSQASEPRRTPAHWKEWLKGGKLG